MLVLQHLEATLGGTGLHVSDLITGLQEYDDIDIVLVYSTGRIDSKFKKFIEVTSCQKVEFNFDYKNKIITLFNSYWITFQVIKKLNPDIIHMHGAISSYLIRSALCIMKLVNKNYNPTVIYTTHGGVLYSNNFFKKFVFIFFEKILKLIVPTIYVAVSKSNMNHISSYFNVPESEIKLIYNSIVSFVSKNKPAEVHLKNRNLINILYPALFTTNKGQYQFILSLLKIDIKIISKFNIHFVGDGPELEKCKSAIRGHLYENFVIFHGYKSLTYCDYVQFDFTCLLSKNEAFGYVLLESLSAKVPVITYDKNPFNEICNQDNAFFTSLDSLDECLQRCIIYKKNNCLKELLSFDMQNKFSIEKMVMSYFNLYSDMHNKRFQKG